MNKSITLGGIAVGLIALGTIIGVSEEAHAVAAGCTAGALSEALGQTASGTGAWLNAHPEANDVITSVGETGNKDAVRVYFVNHQSEWAELQAIAAPLRSLRDQCGGDGAAKAASIGDLYQAQVGG